MPYPSSHPILYVMWMDIPDGGNAQKLIKARFQFLDRRVRNRISFGGLVVEKLALLAIGRQQSTATTTAAGTMLWHLDGPGKQHYLHRRHHHIVIAGCP